MDFLNETKKLRAIADPHYNCAQAVVIPFAEARGLTHEQAYDFAANFGAGMKMGGTCGAITGGLMALGLYGVNDGATIKKYYDHFRDAHDGMLNCVDLLRTSAQRGEVKKNHCDGMFYEAVKVVTEILKERGKI